MSDVYSAVGDARPSYSAFKFHPTSTFDFELGQVIPILRMDCIPGDRIRFENGINIQFMPLTAPLKHNITAYVNYFFVPYRILWNDWVTFITGGEEGWEANNLKMPSWLDVLRRGLSASDSSPSDVADQFPNLFTKKYTYWDYVGNPLFNSETVQSMASSYVSNEAYRTWLDNELPHCLDLYAYNMIYNEWYRDQNVMDKRAMYDYSIFNQCWNKDYFTSALPWQQRGMPARVPITMSGTYIPLSVLTKGTYNLDRPHEWAEFRDFNGFDIKSATDGRFGSISGFAQTPEYSMFSYPYSTQQSINFGILKNEFDTPVEAPLGVNNQRGKILNQNLVVSLESLSASGFSISITDLRLASSLQRWMERNARTGVRYVEFLKGHYNVNLPDSTAQRPILLGSTSQDIIVSDVFQTSQTSDSSPLGTLAGNASSASFAKGPEFHCLEYGVVLALLSVVPAPSYMSQGLDKSWTRKTRFDFAFPEFMHLSECPIKNRELFWDPSPSSYTMNDEVFGYQSAWDEYRQMFSHVCGSVRDSMDAWTLSRKFESQPHLNADFLEIDGKAPDMKRIFSAESEPGMICYAYNQIDALRPIPYISEPMLIA